MTTCPGCHGQHLGPRSTEQLGNLLRENVRRSMSLGREAVNFLRVQARLVAGEIEGLCAGCSWAKAQAEIGDAALPVAVPEAPGVPLPVKLIVIPGGCGRTTAEEYAAASGEPVPEWMLQTHDGERR